jgi:TRAP-type C4-dicarboxylate transport system permease small subunit
MRPAALVLRVIDALADASVVMALIGELALIVANVVARAYLHRSFLWTDEVARLTLSILGFIGGAVAYRRGDHAHVRIVQNLLPDRARRFCLALADTLVVFAATLIAVASFEFITSSWGERTPILQFAGGFDRNAAAGRHGAAGILRADPLSPRPWCLCTRLRHAHRDALRHVVC